MNFEISFIQEIETHQQFNQIFNQVPTEERNKFCQQLTPSLFQFHVSSPNNQQHAIFRTYDQIVKFIKQWNKKVKEMKISYKLTFQQIKRKEGLQRISSIKGFQQQNWFKQFFDLDNHFANQKVSVNLQKQSGGRHFQLQCCLCLKWKKCKAYVLNDGVVTFNESKKKIQQFLHFGKDFTWQCSQFIEQLIIIVHSYHRKLTLRAKTQKQFFIFTYNLNKYLNRYKKQQMEYRFNSFAPVRHNNEVDFFVDGADYFEAVAHAIQNAHESVFICGWWVSPEFMLIRSRQQKFVDYRLDMLLARTAKKGVKIYVIVYYQSSFLTNDSTYTIQALQALHSNIKVLRHPQIVLPTFWSHHQKLIVIDQVQAFMGGLDICYGRYDTQQHLIDEGSKFLYPGIQYNNCRVADFVEVRNFWQQNVERTVPRLPWHDVTLTVKGKAVKDLSRHFIQYWNYASYQTHYAERYVLVSNSSKVIASRKSSNIFDSLLNLAKQKINIKKQKDLQKQVQLPQERQKDSDKQIEMKNEARNTWNPQIQKQPKYYLNNGVKKKSTFENVLQKISSSNPLCNSKQEKQKMINFQQKQSPTNQLISVTGQIEDEIAENQVNYKLQSAKSESCEQKKFEEEQHKKILKTQQQVQKKMTQLAKIDEQIQREQNTDVHDDEDFIQQKNQAQHQQVHESPLKPLESLKQSIVNKLFPHKRSQSIRHQDIKIDTSDQIFTCQAVRSASQWSIGCQTSNYEKSIHDGYLSLISRAEKFIYIQNQFFISATKKNGVVKNQIMDAICSRIVRAIQEKEQFKVVIIMPLIPGFAGELDDPNASLPRVIMNWQYKSLCRGEESLIGRLQKYTETPSKYLQILGLRKHGLLSGTLPVTQIIYLHSKLMIVDDRYLICGSANINDRSMEGNRDSELCLIVEAKPQKNIILGNSTYKVVEKIHNLRVKLWEEHFGISQFSARNAISDKLWEQIKGIAHNNTLIYRKIFKCYPDDEIKSLLQIKPFKKAVSKQEYEEESHKIQGHAVEFPLLFLENEKLSSYHPSSIST